VTPFERFLAEARASDEVLGLVLMGSRAADAYVTDASDHDVLMIVRGDPEPWHTPHGSPVETWPMTLDGFRVHGLSEDAWNRPAFLEAKVIDDRLGGEITRLVEAKRTLLPAEARSLAHEAFGAYLNSLYRSLRNLEAGRTLEGRVDARECIGPLLTAIFAFEGRVRPFNKWLRHELAVRPVRFEGLAALIEEVVADASPAAQRTVLRRVEPAAREAGHGDVIDDWEPHVAWLRGE
jgi:hypothetical protein